MLQRTHPRISDVQQIVLPANLTTRVLKLAHYSKLARHPGQTRMYNYVKKTYYWPHMAADIYATVRSCSTCAKNRLKLRRALNPLKLFPATKPLTNLCIDILRPLTKSKRGCRFLLVITDRFTKLTQVVPLRSITAYTVAVAFTEHWVFKYGAPESVISDNGKQFAAIFFQSVCSILAISNIFTSTYRPETNSQVERYNRTILAMLRNFVNEHQDDWDKYATVLTYAYNSHVHRTTGTTPFNLVLSRPPPLFHLDHSADSTSAPSKSQREDHLRKLHRTIKSALTSLHKTQARYKKDFDKRVRSTTKNIRAGQYIYLDPTDGTTKGSKLGNHALGPFRVIKNDKRTLMIERDGNIERVSANRVRYVPPPDNAPPPEALAATEKDLQEKNLEGPKYVMEEILDHRVLSSGAVEFRIKWYGYGEPTWQPRSDIPEEAIATYLSRRRRYPKQYSKKIKLSKIPRSQHEKRTTRVQAKKTPSHENNL